MKRFYFSLLVLLPVFFLSCQKEVSLETGSLPGDSSNSATNTCDLAKMVEADSATGKGEYAYISSFNSNHKVVNFELVDSSSNAIDGSFALTYPTGRIQLDPEQYFLIGTDGKITEFHGYEYPGYKQGEKFVVKYTYNTAGQLTLRTETYDSLPGKVLYQMKFTYSGGNLTKETIEGLDVGGFVKLAELTYTYDASKTVKNFIYIYGLAPEISTFQAAINAGVNNANPVSRIVSMYYDPSSGATQSVTTNLGNYVIDPKGYVQSFTVSGADFALAGLLSRKRYKLSYNCY